LGAPAPLISIPQAPTPSGGHAEWFYGSDGARLRAALFPPPGPARGSVVLSPGRTEPIEKYFETIADLTDRGFQVLVHDWRGQGLSQRLLPDPLKGHAHGFAQFLADHRALLDVFGPRLAEPWLALGHSMGGCLVLLALVAGEDRFAGAVLSAPMLAVSTAPWPTAVARALAWFAGRLGQSGGYVGAPYDPLAYRFGADVLTHDRTRYDRYKAQLRAEPKLALSAPTWAWLEFALSAGDALAAPGALEAVVPPVTLVLAGDDRLVSNRASRSAAARLPGGRCVEIPGAYHEILMETDDRRDQFWVAFDQLADRISPRPA